VPLHSNPASHGHWKSCISGDASEGYVKPWSAKTTKVQQRNNEPKVKGSTAPIHEAIKQNMVTNTF